MREATGERTGRPVRSGPGLLLVIAYGTLALAALVYVVATWALLTDRRSVASATITVEAVGVLLVGALSYLAPDLFPDKTVWSHFGSGYGFLPLVLPFVGLWWLRRTAPAVAPTTS